MYFAGRNFDWLRVDGENFAAAPLERILVRHYDIDLAAVYAVPNSDVGDDVMAAVIHRPSAAFDPDGFARVSSSPKRPRNQMDPQIHPLGARPPENRDDEDSKTSNASRTLGSGRRSMAKRRR